MNNATIAGFIPRVYVPHVTILTAVFVLSVFMIIIAVATYKLHQARRVVSSTTNNTTHCPNYGAISSD